MKKYQSPYLEPYTGRGSRHECPGCHDPHSFTYYIDGNTEQVIHETVGRCNHESSCGYHYTPKQYFTDNPHLKCSRPTNVVRNTNRLKKPDKEQGCISHARRVGSIGWQSNFVAFLTTLFHDTSTVGRLVCEYYLGQTGNKSVIYWQVDDKGLVRTGKIMQYDPVTGKRVKDSIGAINWMHADLKKKGVLPKDYNLVQCLFGEHLLRRYPDKVVELVESEKSAVIGSGVFPNYVWLATGGKSQLCNEKLKVLKGRTIIMFPDVDGFERWSEKAKELDALGYTVMVSDLLEKNATPEERDRQIDIADWLATALGSGQ